MLTDDEVALLGWCRGYFRGDLTAIQRLCSSSPAVTTCTAGLEKAISGIDGLLRRQGVDPESLQQLHLARPESGWHVPTHRSDRRA